MKTHVLILALFALSPAFTAVGQVPVETVETEVVETETDAVVTDAVVTDRVITEEVVVESGTVITGEATQEKTQQGIVSEISKGGDSIKLRSEDSSIPMTFGFTVTTKFLTVDGDPFEVDALKLGDVVTVHYLPAPEELKATRVVLGAPPELVPVDTVTETTEVTTTPGTVEPAVPAQAVETETITTETVE